MGSVRYLRKQGLHLASMSRGQGPPPGVRAATVLGFGEEMSLREAVAREIWWPRPTESTSGQETPGYRRHNRQRGLMTP